MHRFFAGVRNTVLALGLLALSTPQALALSESEASAFVKTVVDRVVALIETNDTTAERRSEFRGVLTEVAAMPP